MFDAFTGVVSALCLLVGSLQASYCLLVTWLVVTLLASAKHLGVVITHDWTDQVEGSPMYRISRPQSVPMLSLGGLAECGGAGVHQPGGHPGLGTLQAGQVAPEEWTWSLWLLWTGVDGHFVLFAMTFCNYNQDKESKMAGLGNKKSEVAKVLYFLNFRISIKIVSE